MLTDIACRHPGRGSRRGAALLFVLFTAACATRVTSSTPAASPEAAAVPRPTRILVTNFQVDPDAVRQDQAIGLRLQRSLDGGSPSVAREMIAAEVQSAISDTVVDALRKAGLPAEHAPANESDRPGDLVVTGRVLRIDEGNRARRMTIGFGVGKSAVAAVAQLYAIVPNRPAVLLQTYDGKADSGHKPGLAVGGAMAVAQSNVAIGALSAVTNVGGEARRSAVGQEAASFGHRLATEIGKYAAGRAWIPSDSVPAWTR